MATVNALVVIAVLILKIACIDSYSKKVFRSIVREIMDVMHLLLQFFIVCDPTTPITRVEDFSSLKTTCTYISIIEDALSFILHAKTMGCIVNHFQIVFLCTFCYERHNTRITKNMSRQNSKGEKHLDNKVQRARLF
jgi:uncharacterized membrane protein